MIFLNNETIGNDHVLSRQIAFVALSIAQYRVADNFKLRRIKLYVCIYMWIIAKRMFLSIVSGFDDRGYWNILTLFQNSIPLLVYTLIISLFTLIVVLNFRFTFSSDSNSIKNSIFFRISTFFSQWSSVSSVAEDFTRFYTSLDFLFNFWLRSWRENNVLKDSDILFRE